MHFRNAAMENSFVGASAAASFGMSDSTAQNVPGTAMLAVSIFILRLLHSVRIIPAGVVLAVLAIWNQKKPCKIGT